MCAPKNTAAATTVLITMLIAGLPAVAATDDPAFARPTNGADLRHESGYALRLAEFAFDPIEGLPALPGGWEASSSNGSDLYLVQLEGPTTAAALESIESRGVEILQYIYPFTYIVWGNASAVQDLVSVSAVRAIAEFAPAFRVQPQWRELGGASSDVRVLIYRGANTDTVVDAIESIGGVMTGRRVIDSRFEIAGFVLPGDRIRTIARLPGVYSVQLQPTDGGLRSEMSDQVCVGNVDGGNLAFPGYLDWLAGVGLDGDGVAIANVDGGVSDNHPDLVDRMLPCVGDTCGGSDSSSHGTHTAGIMAADGRSGVLDGFGFLRGLGVAPGAGLVEQVYSPWFSQPGGMLKLMTDSSRNGASHSGNSWGPSGSPHGYDNDTLQVDIGVRDADPDEPGNQPLGYVLSIMNGNGGTSSQGTPDEAKNIFTIGSTKMQTGSGSQIPDIDDLSANSAHGPALDGRKIPHMVAPGCEVDSTVPGGYGLKCGTSMASPHVSGAIALFIEFYRGLVDYTEDPSPAMVKAAFLAAALDLAGHDDADGSLMGHPFDNKQGWGRMDVDAVVNPPENSVRYFDQQVLMDDTDEEWVTNVSPLDAELPVRIMLAWTDAPGHGLGGSTPAWNNDLDLIVEVGSDVYVGNNFGEDGFSVPGGTADFMNNTEGVFLETVPGGGITIRVLASNINSDGVPGVGDGTDQDFALACYNCAVEPGFTLAADPTSMEVCAPDSAEFALEVGEILGFTDPVDLSVQGVPAGATANFSVNPVLPPGSSTLIISDTDGAAHGEYELTVAGLSGELERSVAVDLRIDTAIPDQVALVAPEDGSVDVPVAPTLAWSTAEQAVAYELEVARDPGFEEIAYSAVESGTTHAVMDPLDTLTTYHWHVRAYNGCGQGEYSPTYSFTTLDFPPLLLVDDDDNGPDVRAAYVEVLEALGVPFDLWDTGNSDAEPQFADLAPYEATIWFTGDEYGGAAGPGPVCEPALSDWLDAGNCLLLASQDYHFDRGLTPFMQSHLGVASVDDDEGQTSVTGDGVVFDGLGPFSLSYPYTNYSDIMVPGAEAEVAFAGDQGTAAVSKATGGYLTTYWSFGLEAVPDVADRVEIVSAFFEACETLLQDSDLDGVTNDLDCAPEDADNWAIPGPAQDLIVKKIGLANLTWSAPDEPGATSVVYDVLRSSASSDFSAATCLATATGSQLATDFTHPSPGELFSYLIRVRNPCGDTMGSDSSGQPRPGASCD